MSCPISIRRFLLVVVLSALVAALMMLESTQAQTAKGKKYALLVGVRSYDHRDLKNLKHTENDVEELAKVLGKSSFKEVVVLTTTRGEKSAAAKPTAQNIRAELKRLLKKVSKHDTMLVALSGHGLQFKLLVDGKPKDESFFCPANAKPRKTTDLKELSETMLGYSELFQQLDDSGVGVKLLLVDACRNEPAGLKSSDVDTVPLPTRGTAALFSCKSGEYSHEVEKLKHGIFFHFVIEGLRGKAKNEEGEVTWTRLAEYVSRQVSRQSPKMIADGDKQTPHEIRNLEGDSPILIAPTKEEVVKGWGKEINNSIGMKLVRIPPGKFMMGSSKKEQDEAVEDHEKITGEQASDKIRAAFRGQGPQHEVEITKEFWLGIHEVTQKQFKTVMGYNPSHFSRVGEGKPGEKYDDKEVHKPGGGRDKVIDFDNTDDFPVENVSWLEAQEFCKKLSDLAQEKRSGRKYRLPTEAEWEYSCRGNAPSYQFFHFGNSLSSRKANFDGRHPFGEADKGVYLRRTCKVGSYEKNRFGLFDMHGNVNEWCSDWYGKDFYAKSRRLDPSGPSEGVSRVVRGGCWSNLGRRCRSVHRRGRAPAFRNRSLGFRVAAVPSSR